MMKAQAEGADLRKLLEKLIAEQAWAVVEALVDLKKPIICGINGPAVGCQLYFLFVMSFRFCSDLNGPL